MAAAQAAVGALSGAGVGTAAPTTAGTSRRPQIVCTTKAGLGTSIQPGSLSISSVPERRFAVAGENVHKTSAAKLEVAPVLEDDDITVAEEPSADKTPEEISAFMADVANLVKLVNSRDIVELELKHKDYEVVIRKEAKQPPPPPLTFPGPHVMAHTSLPGYAEPPPLPPTPATLPVATEPAPVATSQLTPAKPSHPPMLSPMAGTFYRSPGPGEQPFVQVGDKVTKGQVVCIVEAMKLMNEIEADQSGTIVEILAEDGKPVSIETPLYSIKP